MPRSARSCFDNNDILCYLAIFISVILGWGCGATPTAPSSVAAALTNVDGFGALPTEPGAVADADQDGVPDSEDPQPDNPDSPYPRDRAGCERNNLGCTDTDGDGVPNYSDLQPDDPDSPYPRDRAGCERNKLGCTDADLDGVPDYRDPDPRNPNSPCPRTPDGLTRTMQDCSPPGGEVEPSLHVILPEGQKRILLMTSRRAGPPTMPQPIPAMCQGVHASGVTVLAFLGSTIVRNGFSLSGSSDDFVAQAGVPPGAAIRFFIDGNISGATLQLTIHSEPAEFGYRERWNATVRAGGERGIIEGRSSGTFTPNECIATWSEEPFVAEILPFVATPGAPSMLSEPARRAWE